MHNGRIFPISFFLVALILGTIWSTAHAQPGDVKQFEIAPQALDAALLEFSEQAELQLVVPARLLEGIDSPGFIGEGTAEVVLVALLNETGLKFDTVGATVAIRKDSAAQHNEPDNARSAARLQQSADEDETKEVDSLPDKVEEDEQKTDGLLELGVQTVTGSRLEREAGEIAGQIITLSNEDLRRSGAPTLEQALRQLPQNINGVTEFLGPQFYSDFADVSGRLLGTANVNGSSTINLRGLGDSATLILIDGKRVGDSGMLGGFTDISEIPISMIERVEIQLDSASSVYGSDAIGGVVNIILKKYDFVQARLRRTARTRGGST